MRRPRKNAEIDAVRLLSDLAHFLDLNNKLDVQTLRDIVDRVILRRVINNFLFSF